MVNVTIEEFEDSLAIEPLDIKSVSNIAPVTIETVKQVEKIAPVAVHIKELNQVDPFTIESLRVDSVRHVDPLQVERLNITRMPVVNLSVSQVPSVDIGIRRMPPLAVGIDQSFDLPSQYLARVRLLGFEVLRAQITGCTRVVPRDRVPREQAHAPERSYPSVAPVGQRGIPVRREEVATEVRACRPALSLGPPRYQYPVAQPGVRSG